MTWIPPQIDRIEPAVLADESTTMRGFLSYHRQTLLWKCQGLTAEQLKTAAVPPSTLTLLGLVRHLAEVERSWFRRRLGATDLPWIYCTDERPDGDFDDVAGADPEADFATYHAEVAAADAVAAGLPLETTFVSRQGNTLSLRWLYAHMIEEYARHNGHADLLREAIDGAVGE
jgi:DNA mismatch repair protein MutH